jgi:trimeric autotransporter adhesin
MMRRLTLLILSIAILCLAGCSDSKSTTTTTTTGGSGSGQVTLQSIQLSPSSASIAQGTTQAFTASAQYSDGSTKDVTATAQWSCLMTNIATVSSNAPTEGLATGVASGTALISASFSGVTNSAALNVKPVSVSSIAVTPATATIGFENQQQFTATATFSDGSTQDVTTQATWFGFPAFVTTNSGLAIGQGFGTGSIIASFNDSGSAQITVDASNLVSISVSPSNPTIADRTPLTFSAIGTFNDGSIRDVSSIVLWSNDNPAVANFGNTPGKLTTSSAGTTNVTATVGTLSASTLLTVSSATLNSIAIFPVNANIAPTTKLQLTALGMFSDGSTQDLTSALTWSSSDASIATVNSSGSVTGVSSGSTTIDATSSFGLGLQQASVPINITSSTLASLGLSPTSALMVPGSNLTYTATGTFSDGTTQDLSAAAVWASSAITAATVKAAVATGQGVGSTVITATLGSISATSNLSIVSPAQFTLAITPATAQIANQTSTQLAVAGTYTDGTTQDLTSLVTWSSSTPAVATVGYQNGVVTGLSAGQSTITATLGSATSTAAVTLTNATLQSITVLPANPSVTLGNTQQFTATGNFSDNSIQPLLGAVWSSSNLSVAPINTAGLASTLSSGSATITATLNGVSGSTTLTVP